MKDSILYIVVPCYNEEEVLEETTKRLTIKLQKMIDSKIISKKKLISNDISIFYYLTNSIMEINAPSPLLSSNFKILVYPPFLDS